MGHTIIPTNGFMQISISLKLPWFSLMPKRGCDEIKGKLTLPMHVLYRSCGTLSVPVPSLVSQTPGK